LGGKDIKLDKALDKKSELIVSKHPTLTKQSKRTVYPEETKIMAISLNTQGYSIRKVAEMVGASKSQVENWVNLQDVDMDAVSDMTGRIKSFLHHKYMLNIEKALNKAHTDEKMDAASYYQLVTGSAIMFDKMRLLNGESTENHHHLVEGNLKVSTEKKSKLEIELAELEAEIEALDNKLFLEDGS